MNLQPNSIHFQTGEQSKCVMRIEADCIWVDPDVEVTEAAKLVLEALESNIKMLIAHEREACAKVCEEEHDKSKFGVNGMHCAAAIRARGEK